MDKNKKIIAAIAVTALFVTASFITIGYPFFFRGSIAQASYEVDEGEGKTLLDSKVVFEFRGSLSEDSIRESLTISPNVSVGKSGLRVEHIAAFPWHERFPWAKTRVTINPGKLEVFEPETNYSVSVNGELLGFRTITLPRVTKTVPSEGSENVEITEPVKIFFNEDLHWDSVSISIDPQEALTLDINPSAKSVVIAPPAKPWRNSTAYTVTLQDVTDKFGHQMKEDFVLTFTTEPPVSIVEATPNTKTQPLNSIVKMVFDRAPLPAAAEESFVVTSGIEGTLDWENETTLVWTPVKLDYSTVYTFAIGGSKSWQDPITEHNWEFRTQDPPVFVEIDGGSSSPATLTAVPSGGLGEYTYKWSTSETSQKITAKVPAGETWSFSVTATSGDQIATAEIAVKGPPLPPPPPPPPPVPALGGGMKFVLTFDDSDGSGAIVSGILDILARYGAKAIFFPTGSWAAGAGAPYVQRMLAEGHMVCNHTRDHANLTLLSEAGIREQILGGAGVGTCNLLRPPYGNGCTVESGRAYIELVVQSLGYSIYCWTVDPRDWSGTSVSYITSTILNKARPGGIVVLHMHAYNTMIALPGIIEGLQVAGYTLSY